MFATRRDATRRDATRRDVRNMSLSHLLALTQLTASSVMDPSKTWKWDSRVLQQEAWAAPGHQERRDRAVVAAAVAVRKIGVHAGTSFTRINIPLGPPTSRRYQDRPSQNSNPKKTKGSRQWRRMRKRSGWDKGWTRQNVRLFFYIFLYDDANSTLSALVPCLWYRNADTCCIYMYI